MALEKAIKLFLYKSSCFLIVFCAKKDSIINRYNEIRRLEYWIIMVGNVMLRTSKMAYYETVVSVF